MNIKDFKLGDTIVLVSTDDRYAQHREPQSIHKITATVTKIGRSVITVSYHNSCTGKFYPEQMIVDKTNYGAGAVYDVYLSVEHFDQYIQNQKQWKILQRMVSDRHYVPRGMTPELFALFENILQNP